MGLSLYALPPVLAGLATRLGLLSSLSDATPAVVGYAASALQPSLKHHGTWSPEAWRALQEVYANSRLLANSCITHRAAASAQQLANDAPGTPGSDQVAAPDAPGAAPGAPGPGSMQVEPLEATGSLPLDARRGAVRALFAPGERVRVAGLLPGPPDWFRPPLGLSLSGVQFFGEALVQDADDDLARSNPEAARQASVTIRFHLARPWQCIGFHLGYPAEAQDTSGSPLLSYSMPVAFYSLPGGELWCQHIDFLDAEDVAQAATKAGLPYKHLTQSMHPQELLAAVGFKHTPLDDAEFYCHVYPLDAYHTLGTTNRLPADAFFCRAAFDPATMRFTGPWTPPAAFAWGPWNTPV